MTEDIRSYVQTCQKCQIMNPKFQKSQSSLHPIQVLPKVWSQVSEVTIGSTCAARVLCPRMNASSFFLYLQALIGPFPTRAQDNKKLREDVGSLVFDEEKLRTHIAQSFEQEKLFLFPTSHLPRLFHLTCVDLKCAPEDDWFCGPCQ